MGSFRIVGVQRDAWKRAESGIGDRRMVQETALKLVGCLRVNVSPWVGPIRCLEADLPRRAAGHLGYGWLRRLVQGHLELAEDRLDRIEIG